MVTMEDTQGREYEIIPDGVEALEALGWKRIGAESDEATASGDDGDTGADGADGADGAESDEATDSDDDAPAAPRRGRPRKK